jgi:hypothetical protein
MAPLLRTHRRYHAQARTAALNVIDRCGIQRHGREERGRQPKLLGMGRGVSRKLEETPYPAVSPGETFQVAPAIVASAWADMLPAEN